MEPSLGLAKGGGNVCNKRAAWTVRSAASSANRSEPSAKSPRSSAVSNPWSSAKRNALHSAWSNARKNAPHLAWRAGSVWASPFRSNVTVRSVSSAALATALTNVWWSVSAIVVRASALGLALMYSCEPFRFSIAP